MLASSSKGNCYKVSSGDTTLLLECGIPFKEIQKLLSFKTSEIEACLITHEHKDHCKSIKEVIKAGIDCYMSPGTVAALKVDGHRVKPIQAKKQFAVGAITVLPFDVEHDCAEPLGFLLADQLGDKLLYVTDTYYLRYKFKGLTHIMIECNHSYEILSQNVEAGLLLPSLKDRLIRSHFSLENVKECLRANDLSQVREIHLIHLSGSNSDANFFKREIQALTGKMVLVAGQ